MVDKSAGSPRSDGQKPSITDMGREAAGQISRRGVVSLGAGALAAGLVPEASIASESVVDRGAPSRAPMHGYGKIKIAHHQADLGDVRLHYVTAGSGEPIVLLHGWPETCYQWREVIPQLATRYRVIAPDLRGLGDSSRPAAGYDKRTIANDVWRLVHEVLGCEHCFVAGFSWGAVVAYSLAAAQPSAVRGVAIIGAPPPYERFKYGAWWHFFHQVPELPEALIRGRERLYFSWFWKNFAHPSFVMPEAVITEYLRTFSQPDTLRAALEYYRTIPQDMAHNNELAASFQLPMPVLGISHEGPWNIDPTGAKMVTNHVADALRPLAKNVSDTMFTDTGYLIPEEKPQLLAEVLATFFEGSKPPSRVG